MDPEAEFRREVERQVRALGEDEALHRSSIDWIVDSSKHRYTYNFRWLGRPIIQFPQDMIALQEIIWDYRPDVIVETGIAHGGSLVFHASMLELIGGEGRVIGIDIDIRAHNRRAIEAHPMFRRISLVEGSSVDPETARRVHALAGDRPRTLVILDSNHTHEHVLAELRLYASMVRPGGYLVVLDTVVEDVPAELHAGRPWGPGNNPKTAVHAFLRETDRFEIDAAIHDKLQITVAPDGYLKCVKD
ncbi:MAG: cephalosporin hydroxylase family protein [Burkholderiales bacterium]|nr:cephalosporin hydroxylase family protein [Burkholderiales bacterium]